MEQAISEMGDETQTEWSDGFYTPLETPLATVTSCHRDSVGVDDDVISSTGTISSTESFPAAISSPRMETKASHHMMEEISVKLTEHLNTHSNTDAFRLPCATPSLRRRWKKPSSTQSLTPVNQLTPVNHLSRCHSFSNAEESTVVFVTPIRPHILPSESFRLSSAGNNSEDLFWNKLPEEISPSQDDTFIFEELPAIVKETHPASTKEKQNQVEGIPYNNSDIILDEALIKTFALTDLDLSFISCSEQMISEKELAKFQWLATLARWRHKEMEKAMMAWPTSHFFEIQQGGESISYLPTPSVENDDIQHLSPYLAEFGSPPCCCSLKQSTADSSKDGESSDPEELICVRKGRLHRWEWGRDGTKYIFKNCRQELQWKTADFSNKLEDLITASEERLPEFKSLLQLITSDFALENPSFHPWTACVKSRERVVSKAILKYKGDVTEVKDILRGSVFAPNDSSLVCALLSLSKASRDKSLITIVRLKNLFRVANLGTLVPTNLPTGYRHVLVNIRLSNGLLAEIQFHLLQMYELMGTTGYQLHQFLMGYWASDSCEKRCEDLHDSFKVAEPPVHDVISICSCSECLFEVSIGNRAADRMISHALGELNGSKWDIGSYMCLSELLQARFLSRKDQNDKIAALSLLGRALEVADRTSSVGMIGWEAYGMSSSLDRVSGRQVDILSNHASFLATTGDWEAASDIFLALLSKCERLLGLCHPRTIVALLDLASCSMKSLQNRDNKGIIGLINRANNRVSFYLKQQVQVCSKIWEQKIVSETDEANNTEAQSARSTQLNYLLVFASTLSALLKRPMVRIAGYTHPTTLFLHGYIADSLSILALYSKGSTFDSIPPETCWSNAGNHFRIALKGWITLYGRKVSHVCSTACGLARCLWELGKGREAYILLSKVIMYNGQSITGSEKMVLPDVGPNSEASVEEESNLMLFDASYEMSLAFSIWWMCVYFARKLKSEGVAADKSLYIQIMNLLGASAEHLRKSLQQAAESSKEGMSEVRMICESALGVVENEMKILSSTINTS